MNASQHLALLAALLLAALPPLAQAVTCQNDIPASNPDDVYADHGDGTVTDTRTGLVWKKCSEGQTYDSGGNTCSASDDATTHPWSEALTLAEAHSFAGHDDWRLPNLKELRSLVEECRSEPSINDDLFPDTPDSAFWSGSPSADVGSFAWVVHFQSGDAFDASRSGVYRVRLVRGGRSFARFDAALDYTPDALGDYTPVTDAPVGAIVESNESRTLSGLTTVTGIKVEGGGSPQYRVNGGDWTATPGEVSDGDQIEVRLTASDTGGAERVATLTVGGVTAQFSVTTEYTSHSGDTATGTGSAEATISGGGAGCGFTNAAFVDIDAVAEDPPAGVTFPHGLFDFTLGGCTVGGTVEITVTYPEALPAGTEYWKYGPTPDDATPHWYVIPADFDGATVTFSITDGGLGDDDLTENGTIVDQGGPGQGAGGIPTLSQWTMLLLSLMMTGIAIVTLRRRAV
jgi:hypothetical protein